MKRVAALIIATLWLAGCKVDQDKEVAEYRKLVDLPPASMPATDGPLTLKRAMWLTNQQNERLSIEGENYLQAMIDRQRAVSAFLPTISLAPTYTRRDRTNGGNTANSQDDTLDVPVRTSIDVFNGFGDVARLNASKLTIEQRRALLLDVQESLLADVARVFYDVRRNEELIRVLENSLKVQDERVRDIRARREAGTARPLDVAQAEAQASATRVTLIDARSAARNGRSALAFLTNAPVQNTPLLDDYAPPGDLETIEQWQTLAARQRQDLLGAEQASAAARQSVEAAFRQYYPSITLDLDAFLYRESIPDDRVWQATVGLNLPLFAAGRIRADVREAWSRFRQAILFQAQLQRQVTRDTAVAFENLQSSGLRLAELKTQVAAARAAFEQADASYNVGLATSLERIVAQDQLLSAELQLTGEEYQRKIAYLDLLRATGQLREEFETRISRVAPRSHGGTE